MLEIATGIASTVLGAAAIGFIVAWLLRGLALERARQTGRDSTAKITELERAVEKLKARCAYAEDLNKREAERNGKLEQEIRIVRAALAAANDRFAAPGVDVEAATEPAAAERAPFRVVRPG